MALYCQDCGRLNNTTGKLCQACYRYYKLHPEGRYPLPKEGTVEYASNGDPICHICGEAHRKLGNHIQNRHDISQNEYRDKFKLYHNTRLSNKEYIEQMSNINNKHRDIVVKENLIKHGQNTRFTMNFNSVGRKFQHKIIQVTQNK